MGKAAESCMVPMRLQVSWREIWLEATVTCWLVWRSGVSLRATNPGRMFSTLLLYLSRAENLVVLNVPAEQEDSEVESRRESDTGLDAVMVRVTT